MLAGGPAPRDDGWAWIYDLFDGIAPRGSRLRKLACAYFMPSGPELARDRLVFRALGVGVFGRYIPTGGVAIRRATGARMRPYTLHSRSLRGARDFYYRACVFESLHLPFFLTLLLLAAHRLWIGRPDFAAQETLLNVAVNLFPMLHHRHTRARIFQLLNRAAARPRRRAVSSPPAASGSRKTDRGCP